MQPADAGIAYRIWVENLSSFGTARSAVYEYNFYVCSRDYHTARYALGR